MKVIINDGGRQTAGYDGKAKGDCVTRSIAIVTGKPYQEIYDLVNEFSKTERKTKRMRGSSSASSGVFKKTYLKVLEKLGFEWTSCMGIGTGCKVHLREDELPSGRLLVKVSKHLTAVIDGVIHDSHDPQRNGTRCVYGYWRLAC